MFENRSLFETVDTLLSQHEKDMMELEHITKELDAKIKERDALLPETELLEEVRVFLQTLAETTRDEIMRGLEEVVTLCLQAVFGSEIHFEIEVSTKRNSTGIEFYVVDTSGEEPIRMKPEGNFGGGVLDTISIGLRFGLLKVLNPPPVGPILLDEPAKMVSADRIDSIAKLLKELRRIFDKQIIMVTHHTPLMEVADKGIFVWKENGVSNIK